MISEVFDRLKAALPAGTPLFLGLKHLRENAVPPRLVLVPTRDAFAGADGDALARVEAGFELHIWGRDYREVEGALEEFVSALDAALPGAYALQHGGWADPENRVLEAGVAYVLSFTVRGTVPRRETYATLETIAQACAGTS